jgi:hypothetical protein
MSDNVAELRARWTPETTANALRFLRGDPAAAPVPTLEHDGKTWFDLRGINITQDQLDGLEVRHASLRWSTLRDVGFKNTRFYKCNLSQARFGECYFRGAKFEKCDVVNSKFEECDFSSARFERCWLDFSTFKGCEVVLKNIAFRADATPQSLVRVYRNLKLNAMSMGHFADAGELTYLEKTAERADRFHHAFTQEHEAAGERLRAIGGWVESLLLNAVWGYGEKPWRLVFFMLIDILLFGTLQYAVGGIPGKAWWEYLYFSGITFMTIGYGDLVPQGMLSQFLAVAEGASGVTAFGMLIASATKKIMYR